MSRLAVAAICAAVLLVGFVDGRVTGSPSGGMTMLLERIDRSVVVRAQHLGSARDPRDRGPLDLALVSSVRRGVMLNTTIAAHRAWRDSLLRRGRVRLSLLYDTNDDGRPDRRDIAFLLRGRLTSWISS